MRDLASKDFIRSELRSLLAELDRAEKPETTAKAERDSSA